MPDTVRSLYQRILPPPEFFTFGDSTRFKIIKAFQLHCLRPAITPETDQFIKFFQILSENVQDHWTVQQQWAAAKWAAGYDEPLASALLLNYGWSPRHETRMLGSSMHKISVTEEGVLLDMTYTHTFQERCDAACAEAILMKNELADRGLPMSAAAICSAALRKFYYFKGKYASLGSTYGMRVKGKLYTFIDDLINPLDSSPAITPSIDEPPDLLDDDVILLRWEDFELTSPHTVTEAKIAHNRSIAQKNSLTAFQANTKYLPRGVPISSAKLRDLVHTEQVTAWKKHGFITLSHKEGRTAFYIIPDAND